MRQFKVTDRITPRSTRSIATYYTDVEKYEIITPQEEVILANRIQAGDMAARDKLATANLRFVISVAKMYGGAGDPEAFNDLISAGNIGLIEAAEKFDPSRGFKFISFAVWHIRKEMLKYLGDNSRMIRIPQNKTNELRAIVEETNNLTMKLGRDATFEEVMEEIREKGSERIKSADLSNLRIVMNADRNPASLDAPFKNDGSNDNTMHDVLASDGAGTDSLCLRESMSRMTEILTSSLKPIERTIVLRRHGIETGFEESYSTIAHDLGMSTERIRQIYTKSIRILGQRVKKLKLKEEDVF